VPTARAIGTENRPAPEYNSMALLEAEYMLLITAIRAEI